MLFADKCPSGVASWEAPVSGGVCSRAPPVALDQGRPICRHDARCDRLPTGPGRNDPSGPSPGPELCAPRSGRALDCDGPTRPGSVLPPSRLDRLRYPTKVRQTHDSAPRGLPRLRARARDSRVVRPRLTRPIRTADARTRSGAVFAIRVPDRRPREPVFHLLCFRPGGRDAPLAVSRGALDCRHGRRGVQRSRALRRAGDPRPQLRARPVLHAERRRRELASLAAWPRPLFEEPGTLLRKLLHSAARVLNAPRALLVWEEIDEPWLYLAAWSGDGEFHVWREPPERYDPPVAEPLASDSFLSPDTSQPQAAVLWASAAGPQEWRGAPVHPDLRSRF